MDTSIVAQSPVTVLSEYHLIRHGNDYFIFHKVNGTCKCRRRTTCAEVYMMYSRLDGNAMQERYDNPEWVGNFESSPCVQWTLTAWVWEEL